MRDKETAIRYYEAARQELVKRVELRDQVLRIYLSLVGAVFGAALGLMDKFEILLALPYLGLGCSIIVSQHNAVIGALIKYSTQEILPSDDTKGVIPEFTRSKAFKEHSPRSNLLRSSGHAVIILIPCVLSLLTNVHHGLGSAYPLGPAWWFALVCTILAAGVIWHIHQLRQKVYRETPWEK